MPKIEPRQSSSQELDADQMVAMILEAATLAKRAAQAGSMAPAFRLRDYGGQPVIPPEVNRAGPPLIPFFRGSWGSDFHNNLTDLKVLHDQIHAPRARVVALAPPPPPTVP